MIEKNDRANMQDGFINNCRHEGITVEILLLNNAIESGVIIAFDRYTIVLKNEKYGQFIIMKNSIASIKPNSNVNYIFGSPTKEYEKNIPGKTHMVNEKLSLPGIKDSYIFNSLY